jgi:hypothetical protein
MTDEKTLDRIAEEMDMGDKDPREVTANNLGQIKKDLKALFRVATLVDGLIGDKTDEELPDHLEADDVDTMLSILNDFIQTTVAAFVLGGGDPAEFQQELIEEARNDEDDDGYTSKGDSRGRGMFQ